MLINESEYLLLLVLAPLARLDLKDGVGVGGVIARCRFVIIVVHTCALTLF